MEPSWILLIPLTRIIGISNEALRSGSFSAPSGSLFYTLWLNIFGPFQVVPSPE